MQWRRFVTIPLLLLAAACASTYPYPPQFVTSYEVSPRSIPQPPAKYSKEYNAEIAQIMDRQAHLTPEQLKLIYAEDSIVPERIVQPVLGTNYTAENHPALYTLLKHAASDAWRIGDETRAYWQSPRPWYADSHVRLFVPPIYSYGYPSGHTATYGTWAWILSDLVPAKREQFFTTAYAVAENRINGGAHFPHDIEGGKQLAAAIYTKMTEQPTFQAEFAAVKAELALGGSKPVHCLCKHHH